MLTLENSCNIAHLPLLGSKVERVEILDLCKRKDPREGQEHVEGQDQGIVHKQESREPSLTIDNNIS